jgi:hypothetical protein
MLDSATWRGSRHGHKCIHVDMVALRERVAYAEVSSGRRHDHQCTNLLAETRHDWTTTRRLPPFNCNSWSESYQECHTAFQTARSHVEHGVYIVRFVHDGPRSAANMDSSWLQHADPTRTARDLTVEAAQAVGLKNLKSGSSSRSIPFAKLKALLDSRSDREILEGLRKVVSVGGQGSRFWLIVSDLLSR